MDTLKIILATAKSKKNKPVVLSILRAFAGRFIKDKTMLQESPALILGIYQEILSSCDDTDSLYIYLKQIENIVSILGAGEQTSMAEQIQQLFKVLLRLRRIDGNLNGALQGCYRSLVNRYGDILDEETIAITNRYIK